MISKPTILKFTVSSAYIPVVISVDNQPHLLVWTPQCKLSI